MKTDLEFLERLESEVKIILDYLNEVLLELDDLGDNLILNKLTLKEFARLDKIKNVLGQTKALMESLND